MNLVSKDQGEDDLECLILFYVLCHQVHHPIQQWAEILPSFSFAADVLAEALLVAFHIPPQIQFQVQLGFSNLIPVCLYSVPVFLLHHLSHPTSTLYMLSFYV